MQMLNLFNYYSLIQNYYNIVFKQVIYKFINILTECFYTLLFNLWIIIIIIFAWSALLMFVLHVCVCVCLCNAYNIS